MKKLREFIKQVKELGSVFDYTVPLTLSDWDTIFRRFSSMGIKEGEIMYYCSPKRLQEALDLLQEVNASMGNGSYGKFHKKENAWSFLIEASFLRGAYTVHLVSRDIKGGVLIPTLPEEDWGIEKLVKSSIKI